MWASESSRRSGYLQSHPEVTQQCLQAIGSDDPEAGPDREHAAAVRTLIGGIVGSPSSGSDNLNTPLDATLLQSWAKCVNDPDAHYIHEWLVDGSPAGIELDVTDPGIFPKSGDAAEVEEEDFDPFFFRDPTGHTNYKSVDGDPHAAPEIQRLVDTGFVKVFDSLEECEAWLGGTPLTSKLAMVTKERADGTIKRRLILDCRESKATNLLASKAGRILLPRPTDLLDDALYLLRHAEPRDDHSVEALVLDFRDWFYAVPLHRREQKYFTTAFRRPGHKQLRYIVFLSQTQGSRNAPTVCGRVAALIGRLSQSLYDDQRSMSSYVRGFERQGRDRRRHGLHMASSRDSSGV